MSGFPRLAGALLAAALSAAALSAVTFATGSRAATAGEFGERIARTLGQRDGEGFTALVDRDPLLDRALGGLEGSEAFVGSVRGGLERGLSQVGDLLVDNMGAEARPVYLRTRTADGLMRVLLRVDLGERGLNYLEFLVRQRADGSWGIVDWIDYVQGQTYTESLRMALALMVRDQPSLVERLLGLPDVDRETAKRMAEMGTLGREGDWNGWLGIYRQLPEGVRHSRLLLTGRIAAASMAGDEAEVLSAMADLHARYGDDPTLSLALLDYYVVTGDYARADGAVDRLEETTGGDAALTNLRAGIALHRGDHAASIAHARRAIRQDADYEDPYWNLMAAGVRAGDYEAAMEGVHGLQSRFGYVFSEEELGSNPELAGLLASEEWKRR